MRAWTILILFGVSLNLAAQQAQRFAVDLLNPVISMVDGVQNNMQVNLHYVKQEPRKRTWIGGSIIGMNNIQVKEYGQNLGPNATLTYERYFTLDYGWEYIIPFRSSFYASLGGLAHLGRIQYEMRYHPLGVHHESQWITGISPSIAANRDYKWTTLQLKLSLRSMQSWGEVPLPDGKGGQRLMTNPRSDLYQTIMPYVQIVAIMPLF